VLDERIRRQRRVCDAEATPAARERLYHEEARAHGWQPLRVAGCWLEKRIHTSGAMAWAVRHADSNERQFLRLYPPVSRPDRLLRRLRRDAELRGRVRHPTIPVVHEVGQAPVPPEVIHHADACHFVREQLAEGTAAWYERRAFPWREAAQASLEIAQGLILAHAAGFAHLGITPACLIVTPQPRLLGWRSARELPTERHMEGAFVGTGYWIAPERLRLEQPLQASSDVYGLCATLYSLLTHRFPFCGESAAERFRLIAEAPFPDAREHAPDVPETLIRVIARSVDRDPERRPSMQAIAAGLEAVLAGDPLPADFDEPRRGWRAWLGLGAQ
jgi:serine/threonine protein kinase